MFSKAIYRGWVPWLIVCNLEIEVQQLVPVFNGFFLVGR
jgi:hypothetical protein